MKIGVILAIGLFIFLGTVTYIDRQSVPDLIDRQKSITEDKDFLEKVRLFREGTGESEENNLEKIYLQNTDTYEYPKSTAPYITTPEAKPAPIATPYTIDAPSPQPMPITTPITTPTPDILFLGAV